MPAISGIVVLGWCLGSLINYLADVLPYRRRIVHPFCLQCSSPLSFRNYLFWPRRCSNCGTARKPRIWIVELSFISASLLLWLYPPEGLAFLLGWLLLAYLFLVMVIDLEHRLVLHPVSLAGALLGIITGYQLHGWLATLVGGAAGYAIMAFLYLLGKLFIRLISRLRGATNETALGFGDVNLAGVAGLVLGWPGITAGLLIAFLTSGIAAVLILLIALARRSYHPYMAFPFAPFIAAAVIYLIFF